MARPAQNRLPFTLHESLRREKLPLVEIRVEAVSSRQFFMRSLLDDVTGPQHDDEISVLDPGRRSSRNLMPKKRAAAIE